MSGLSHFLYLASILLWSAQAAAQEPLVRVKISESTAPQTLSGQGLQFEPLSLKSNSAALLGALPQASSWQVRCEPQKASLRLVPTGVPATHPLHAGVVVPRGIRVKSSRDIILFHDKPYPTVLSIHVLPQKHRCIVVNELGLEQYLAGVVNHEFSSKWAPSSVEAQVVAARTYALYRIQEARKKRDALFDIESTEKDQVYGGAEKVDAAAMQAVLRTRGQVLSPKSGTPKLQSIRVGAAAPVRSSGFPAVALRVPSHWENVKPLKAYYHSTCGGMTALPEKIWGQRSNGFRRAVKCEWCGDSPKAQWRTSVSAQEIARAMMPHSKSPLVDLRIREGSLRGRVESLVLTWGEKGKSTQTVVSGHAFRMALGPSRVQSTWFSLTRGPQSGEFLLEGKGYGHGVGLCQWGAKNWGAQGASAAQILAHYYPDSELIQAW